MEKRKNSRNICLVYLLFLCFGVGVNGYNSYIFDNVKTSFRDPHIVALDGSRVRREAPVLPTKTAPPAAPTPLPASATATNSSAASPSPATANADDSNKTVKGGAEASSPTTLKPAAPVASVTQIPLLGQNGTGIRKDVNSTNKPLVSDPISIGDDVDDINSEVFKDSPETLKAEQNITNLKYDEHIFYNSSFIGNLTYFNEYWANITAPETSTHSVLSNSHRRATTLRLSFDFPFYGHPLRNITVATGGFIYTGEHVHNWLAATQYIAPLMANFDTSLSNTSFVKMCDDGEKFTAFWENVTLQESPTKEFTFAVTLYKNGDIVFAYKDVPMAVKDIDDSDHPVKVGISDAYLNDRILFLVRRKTIYEYHRVNFKNHEIASGTILKLVALPTCLQYDSCDACVNHNTSFKCMWCDTIQKCSSGTDRNKQDWTLRSCDSHQVSTAAQCPSKVPVEPSSDARSTAYQTDGQAPNTHTGVNTMPAAPAPAVPGAGAGVGAAAGSAGAVIATAGAGGAGDGHSAVGGVVAAFVAVALVGALAGWTLYAFKNPHTRSGQLLIKYRPSQWSWRRGEARYTAATIHM